MIDSVVQRIPVCLLNTHSEYMTHSFSLIRLYFDPFFFTYFVLALSFLFLVASFGFGLWFHRIRIKTTAKLEPTAHICVRIDCFSFLFIRFICVIFNYYIVYSI